MFNPTNRREFLNLAIVFEGGLVFVALGIAWFADVNPFDANVLAWTWQAVVLGTAAAGPMFALFILSQRFPVGGLRAINQFLIEMLGPPLSICRWWELVLLALLAGACEELLFRGVLQEWFTRNWGFVVALVLSNVLFGLAHLITPTYAVLAGLIGFYLGLLMRATDPPNWLTPAVAHAVYDFLAFVLVAWEYRRQPTERSDDVVDEFGDGDDASHS